MKNKGFALVSVLVLSTVLLIMGMGGMYMTEMGFRSLSAEQRWHRLEKAANAGIMQVANEIASSEQCNINRNLSFNGATVEVRTVSAGSGCFIWSRATLGNSRVVKTATLVFGPTSFNVGVLAARNLVTLNLNNQSYILSCDDTCQMPAAVTGNELTNLPPRNQVNGCPENPTGLTSTVIPYLYNSKFAEDLTNLLFRENNRYGLFNRLSRIYNIYFDHVGAIQINSSSNTYRNNWCIVSSPGGNCRTISNDTISCNNVDVKWENGVYRIIRCNNCGTSSRCNNSANLYLNTGSTAPLNIQHSFVGNGSIGVNGIINITSTVTTLQNITFITQRPGYYSGSSINITANGATFNNVSIIASDAFNINLTNTTWNGGILFDGTGDANIAMNNSNLGTRNNPVLIFNDWNLSIRNSTNSQINGLMYNSAYYYSRATTIIDLSSTGGSLDINGMIVMNTTGNNAVNSGSSGRLRIKFDKEVMSNLARLLDYVRTPEEFCRDNIIGGPIINTPFIQTKTTTY